VLASAVWTGDELIVWGGEAGSEQNRRADGAALDLASGTWRTLAPVDLTPRSQHAALWTGERMIIAGGVGAYSQPHDAAEYDPVKDRWRRLPRSPVADTEFGAIAWTGTQLVGWEVARGGTSVPERSGAAYRRAANRWRPLPDAPFSIPLHAASVWTGCELFVYGGSVAAYSPRAHEWNALPPPPFGGALRYPRLVWSGREAILWGFLDTAGGGLAPAAAYDPVSEQWRRLPDAPLEFADTGEWSGGQQAVWAGDSMIVTTGNLDVAGTRALRLDPDTGAWSELPSLPAGPNYFGTLIWTGRELIDWRASGNAFVLEARAR
jgi:hypothetical protein